MKANKEIKNYVKRNLKNGYSKEQINNALLSSGYSQEFAFDIIEECSERKQLNSIWVYLVLILIVSLSVFFIKPSFIGYVTVSKEMNYSDELNLVIDSAAEYTWMPANKGEIKSIRVSGTFENRGTAEVYIENDNISYKLFDSSSVEGIGSVTGADISEEINANQTGLINETITILSYENVCRETCLLSGFINKSYKLIFELNDTVINVSRITYTVVEEVEKFKIDVLLINSKGIVEHEIKVYKENALVDDEEVEAGLYELEVVPAEKVIEKINFRGVNVSRNFSGRVGIDNVTEISAEGIEVIKSFAVDPSGIEFKNASLKSVAKAPVLYKCKDWNFTEQKCYGNWSKIKNLEVGKEYELEIGQNDPGFIEGFPEEENNAPVCSIIPDVMIAENSSYSFELDDYCSDSDGDKLYYAYNPTENITMNIDESIATIVPNKEFIGVRYTFFIANDSEDVYVSNIVKINVSEDYAEEPERILKSFKSGSISDNPAINTMNVQGRLTSANNTNLNGDYNFTFKLYNISAGGSALWEENHSLNVNDGVYDAIIGSTVPIRLEFDESYYLGISVNDDNEMVPRLNLTSAPYSRRAVMAENLTCIGCVATGEILNETIVADDIATGAVTSNEILDGTIVDEDVLANANINTSKINKTAGIKWINQLLTDILDDIFNMINSTNATSITDLTNHSIKSPIDHPDESVTNAKIAGSAVNTSQIIDETILAKDIKKDSITADRIANSTITTADISDSAGILETQLEKTFVDTAGDVMTGDLIGTGVNISYLNVSGVALINILNVTGSTNIGNINISGVSFAEGDVNVNNNVNLTSDGNVQMSQNLTVGQNAYFNGNLGVGVILPQERLEVDGAVRLGTTVSTNNGTLRYINNIFQGYNGTDWVTLSGGSVSGTTGWVDDGASLRLTDSTDIIGIGTSTPTAKLDVVGTINATAIKTATLNVTGISYLGSTTIQSDNITVNNVVSRDGNISFYNSSGSEKIRLTNEGNLGIGTLTPNEKLTVIGNANITGTVYAHNFSGNSDIIFINNTGDVKMVIKDSGNIGIGTKAPGAKLDIQSSNGTIIVINRTASGNSNVMFANNQTAMYAGIADSGFMIGENADLDNSPFIVIQNNTGNIGIGTTSPSYRLQTGKETGGKDVNLSDVMYINSGSGNLGIGTTSPSFKLHVEDVSATAMNVSDTLYVNGNNRRVGVRTSTPSEDFSVVGNGSFTQNLLVLGNIIGPDDVASPVNSQGWIDEGLFIRLATISDNVGIGTDTPTAKLDVIGMINATILKAITLNITGNSYFGNVSFDSDNITVDGIISRTGNLNFYNGSGSQKMIIKADGNVGIGTLTPNERLTVIGNANITGTVYAHNFSGNSDIVFMNSSGDAVMKIKDDGTIESAAAVFNVAGTINGSAVTVNGVDVALYSGFSGENITSGTVADARIAAAIARDSEVLSVIENATIIRNYNTSWAQAIKGANATHADHSSIGYDLSCTDCIGDTEISTNAGTSLAADLEEEVTEGSLADSVIVSADIKDDTIALADMAHADHGDVTWVSGSAEVEDSSHNHGASTINNDLSCTDIGTALTSSCVSSAGSAGSASDVSCSNCVTLGSETSGNYDSTADTIADDGVISDSEVSDDITINNGVLYAPQSGSVGIGTANPSSDVHLQIHGGQYTSRLQLTNGASGSTSSDGIAIAMGNGGGIIAMYETGSFPYGYLSVGGNGDSKSMMIDCNNGNVGVGVTYRAIAAKLEVDGGGTVETLMLKNLNLADNGYVLDYSTSSYDVNYKSDGSVFTGYHYYEKLNKSETFDMGDAIVLVNGKATKSTKPKEKSVVGIYSGHPMPGGRYLSNNGSILANETDHVEVASVGDSKDWNKVFSHYLNGFKVSDENGDIKPGDFVVTSSTPGYLMKQDDDLVHSYTVGKVMDEVIFDEDGKLEGIYGFIYCG